MQDDLAAIEPALVRTVGPQQTRADDLGAALVSPDMMARRPSDDGDEAVARVVADAVPALLSYWGVDERNVFANEAYARWFGMTPADLRGRHLREVLGQELYDDDREHIRAVLGGVPCQFQREVLRLTGTARAHVACTPDVVDGTVVGFSVLVTEVTDHHDVARADHPHGRPVRAVVVDPSPVARAGLGAILASESGIAVVGEAGRSDEALAVVGEARPDVVVTDARAPGIEQLLAARRACFLERSAFPAVVVLVESEFDEYLLDPLGLGASSVLAKGAAREELADAVRVAAKGDDVVPRRSRGTVILGDRLVVRPTPREREVLELVVRGMSNAEIAKRLYMSVNTLKTHLRHVYDKVGVRSRQELMDTISSGPDEN
ncbi:MAG TPA: LuxR C-terminal-related transcriptional regulator [Acidimicrobiales bacterium]|nr:LuxR C-terminal-related transcriptional regulator [Acidimicrobiales bacterium]